MFEGWGSVAGETERVDEGWGRGQWGGDFTDGMPGWTYFSRATPGHPASN